MKIKLDIIQEDIDKAVEHVKNNPVFPTIASYCPIAQAFKRHGHKLVHIGFKTGHYFDENKGLGKNIRNIPENITGVSYKKFKSITPQTIELDIY